MKYLLSKVFVVMNEVWKLSLTVDDVTRLADRIS